MLLLTIIGGVSVRQLTRADERIQLVVVDTLAPVADVGQIERDYNDILQALMHAALTQLPSSVDDAQTSIKSDRVDIGKRWTSLGRSGLARQQQQLFALTDKHRKDTEQAIDEALTTLAAGQFIIAQLKLSNDVQSSFIPLKSDFSNLFSFALSEGQTVATAQHVSNRHDLLGLLSLVGVAGGLAIWVDLSIIRSLRKRLKSASEVAGRIARGVLGESINVGQADEVGLLLGSLVEMDTQLESVVGQVRERASAVEESAKIIAQGNDALSQRTQTQSTYLVGTAASMARMTAAIAHSVQHADQANEAVNDVQAQAREGQRAVVEANTAMDAINRTGRRMGEVLDLVDQVAFQTNILALNAAVEAAQAGALGRGFAVIATEMRQLSHRCGQAARDIRQMILASDEAAHAGSVLVDRTGVLLEDVAVGVNKLSGLVAAMAATERGHAKDIGMVNDSVVQMKAMTAQNASLVEEASVASQAMQESASSLLHQVHFFTLKNAALPMHDTVSSLPKNTGTDPLKDPRNMLLGKVHA